MSWIKRLLRAIKIICSCKSSCIIGEDIRVTLENTDDNFNFKISYV